VYTAKEVEEAKTAAKLLNDAFRKHHISRQEHCCSVCYEFFQKSGAVSLCSLCTVPLCATCFQNTYVGKGLLELKCMGCSKEITAAELNTYGQTKLYDIVVPGFIKAALAGDAPYLAATPPSTVSVMTAEVHSLLASFQTRFALHAGEVSSAVNMLLFSPKPNSLGSNLEQISVSFSTKENYLYDTLRANLSDVTDKLPALALTSALRFKCPTVGCHCFVQPESEGVEAVICLGCAQSSCTTCHALSPAGHVCSEDVLASLEEIRSSTVPCPECRAQIHRIDGCNQMVCTACLKCIFDYDTGEKVSRDAHIHNPHLEALTPEQRQQLLDAVRGDVEIDPEDIDPETLPFHRGSHHWLEIIVRQCNVGDEYDALRDFLGTASIMERHLNRMRDLAETMMNEHNEYAKCIKFARAAYLSKVAIFHAQNHFTVYNPVFGAKSFLHKYYSIDCGWDYTNYYTYIVTCQLMARKVLESAIDAQSKALSTMRTTMVGWLFDKKIGDGDLGVDHTIDFVSGKWAGKEMYTTFCTYYDCNHNCVTGGAVVLPTFEPCLYPLDLLRPMLG